MADDNELIRQLIKKRKKKREMVVITITVAIVVLSIVNVFFLLILSLLLMLMGVTSFMNTGNAMVKWNYSRYISTGYKDITNAEMKERASNFKVGLIISGVGLLIFFLYLYLASIGWLGLLRF